MKKLMTMVAAVASAFGLYAAAQTTPDAGAISGTSFETTASTEGGFIGEIADGTFWSAAPDVNAFAGVAPAIGRPLAFKSCDLEASGKIKTTLGNPVSRYVNKADDGETAFDLTTGDLYFDSLVKFTVFDETPDFANYTNAKIGLYLQEDTDGETVTGTNLYVWAGAAYKVTLVHDETPVVFDDFADAWHRVTIRAIENAYTTTPAKPAFIIYIDGNYLQSENAKAAFTAANLTAAANGFYLDGALFASAKADTNITAVDFDGQGDVDDLVFTTAKPSFIPDDTTAFKLTWDDTEIASVKDAAGNAVTKGAWYPFVKPEEGQLVLTFNYVANSGYVSGSFTVTDPTENDTVTIDNVKQACFKIGDNSYATLKDAFDAATTAGAEIKVVEDYTLAEDETAVLNNTAGSTTLDLAGKVITGDFSASTALTVMDSAAKVSDLYVGKIDGKLTLNSTASLVVNSGFISQIDNGDTVSAVANGGQFAFDPNDEMNGITSIPADKYAKEIEKDTLWEVVAKTQVTAPTAVPDLKYNGESQTGVVDADGFSLTDNTGVNAGSYTATATLDAGYIWSDGETGTKTIAWSIAQATPTITTDPTASAEIEKDAALSTISLVGGEADVDGAFAWTTPATTVPEDGEFDVTFTPTDTKNYTTATCKVAVKVKAAEQKGDPDAPQPVTPGTEADTAAEWNKNIADHLNVPAGVDSETYCAMFEAVSGGEDSGEVKIQLKADVKEDIAAEVSTSEATILAPVEGKATITARPGLWYGLKAQANLEDIATAAADQWKQATGTTVQFTIEKPSNAKGFYQVDYSASHKE